MKNQESDSPSLYELLSEETIIVKASVSDWKEAIEMAGQALMKIGAIDARYISAMINFKEKFGPYIVITPGVAIPHAKPEDGVKRPCFCLMTLERPITFGHPENDPVFLVIAFGATDHKQHLKALSELAKLLGNREDIERIRQAMTKEEILDILFKYKRY